MPRIRSVSIFPLVAVFVSFLTVVAHSASGRDFYVSPTGSGIRCTSRTPCTVSAAQRAVRAAAANQNEDIHVNFLNGQYMLNQPLTLIESTTTSDSGQNGFAVKWQAAPNAHPVLSGGVAVKGWSLYDSNKNIWRAFAPTELNARQLYINGRRAERTTTSDLMSGYSVTPKGFQLKDPVFNHPIDISKFKNLDDIEVVRLFNWQLSRCAVTGATAIEIEVHPICLFNSKSANLGIFLENAYELLNKPGQWYLDRSGAVGNRPAVYYIPRDRENMTTVNAVLGATEQLLIVEGRSERPIHDVTIEGLAFTFGTWLIEKSPAGKVGGYQGLQAGVHLLSEANFMLADATDNPKQIVKIPSVVGGFYDPVNLGYTAYLPATVTANYANRVKFLNNTFSHLGATALAMVRGIQHSQITGNRFFDVSGSAIQLGGVDQEDHHPCSDVPACESSRITSDNLISNNYVSEVSVEFLDAAAIFIGYTRNTVIAHNELMNLPYSGISMGWGWGWIDKGGILGWKNPSIVANNHITNNSIKHFLTRQRDGAAIYTLGGQPGSLIANNFASDGRNDYAAIYQDEGSSGFTVENNVTTRTKYSLYINCGKNDVTEGNTYRKTYSDFGSVYNTCFRGQNEVETPVRFTDPRTSESEWPAQVKDIVDQSGLEPQFRNRLHGKVTSVDSGPQQN